MGLGLGLYPPLGLGVELGSGLGLGLYPPGGGGRESREHASVYTSV